MKLDMRLSAGCSTCTEGLQVHRARQEGAWRSRRHGGLALVGLRRALLGSMGRRGRWACWLGRGRWDPAARQRWHGRGLRRRGLRLAACCAGPCAHRPVAGERFWHSWSDLASKLCLERTPVRITCRTQPEKACLQSKKPLTTSLVAPAALQICRSWHCYGLKRFQEKPKQAHLTL